MHNLAEEVICFPPQNVYVQVNRMLISLLQIQNDPDVEVLTIL